MFSNHFHRQNMVNSHPNFPSISNSFSHRNSNKPVLSPSLKAKLSSRKNFQLSDQLTNPTFSHDLNNSNSNNSMVLNSHNVADSEMRNVRQRIQDMTTRIQKKNIELKKSSDYSNSNKQSNAVLGNVIRNSDNSQKITLSDSTQNMINTFQHQKTLKQTKTQNSSSSSSEAKDPQTILRNYRSQLTSLEQQEIMHYSSIWFIGNNAKKTEAVQGASHNDGYDDDSGSYIMIPKDHIAYRYEIIENLGQGSFGQVVKAFDHQTSTEVAIKIIRNKKRFHDQSKIEINILNHLKKIDLNSEGGVFVIHLLESFTFRNHPCLVFELLGENLYEVIKRNGYRGFSLNVVQKMCHSLLTCLAVLRKEKIIHCDLKPENILVLHRHSFEIKVIDFGSSCYSNEKVYTYIQSRFYRSPEVILGIPYTTQIDTWSLGCVLPELITGRPIFPGENEMDQLNCIHEVFGLPPKSILEDGNRRKLFYDHKGDPRSAVNSRGKKRLPDTHTLNSLMRINTDSKFLDLVSKCLEWDPKKRITPEQALTHNWMQELNSTPLLTSSQFSGVVDKRSRPRKAKQRKVINGELLGDRSVDKSTGSGQDKENLPPLINSFRNNKSDHAASSNTVSKTNSTDNPEKFELPTLYR